MIKKTICVGFDGVLNEYNGYEEGNLGEPLSASKEFIRQLRKILQAKNFKGLRRDSPFSKGDGWELKTTTDTFKVSDGDLVVIDDDEKIIDCLKHGINTGTICLDDKYKIKLRD